MQEKEAMLAKSNVKLEQLVYIFCEKYLLIPRCIILLHRNYPLDTELKI